MLLEYHGGVEANYFRRCKYATACQVPGDLQHSADFCYQPRERYYILLSYTTFLHIISFIKYFLNFYIYASLSYLVAGNA